MSKYNIEKGVEIPISKRGRRNNGKPFSRYGIHEMAVGDSMEFNMADLSRISSAYSHVGRVTGWKFTTRRNGSTFRIWRIK